MGGKDYLKYYKIYVDNIDKLTLQLFGFSYSVLEYIILAI